jgi:hypothetical protein
VAVPEGVAVALGVAEGVALAPGINVVVPVSVHVGEGVKEGVDEERVVDVPVGEGLQVWVCVDVGLLGVVVGVGVGVDVEAGLGIAVFVGVGEMVEANEGDGEGVGVGESVAVLCCIMESPVVAGLEADFGSQMAPQERASPTSSKGRVGWRTDVLRVMIAPCDPQNFQYYSELN